MVVQHNLTAMNSNRMLGVTTGSQAKSTEKLSSGYKINRAADDAAGLSISEKMRKQIRGLSQASLNAQDGISAVQTAEGALNEVQDMLQRANELAVKSANGTMSANDRSYIQNEIDQLMTEVDRVSSTTKFNETYLLKGDKSVTEYSFGYATTPADPGSAAVAASATATGGGATVTNGDQYTGTTNLKVTYKAANWTTGGAGAAGWYTDEQIAADAAATPTIAAGATSYMGVTIGGTAAAGNVIEFKAAKAEVPATEASTAQYYDKDGNKIAANGLDQYLETTDGTTITLKDGAKLYDKDGNDVTADFDAADFTATAKDAGALTLTLHVGADATENNQISVDIQAMSAEGLGLLDANGKLLVDGEDDTNALAAIDTIKEAIQKVSTQRSALGAVQNRLEHTIANLDNVVENTTAAESQIRDTDMATEMVKYSNNNILAQAGTSMLAQANQANQNILSLLG